MDFAFSKLLLIGAVALIVVGPKELPAVARKAGAIVGRLLAMRDHWMRELRSASDPWAQAGREAGQALAGLHGELRSAVSGDPRHLGGADPWAGLPKAPRLAPKPRIQAKARRARAERGLWERRLRAGAGFVPAKIRPRR